MENGLRHHANEAHPQLPVPLGGELLAEISKMNLRLKISLVGIEKGNFLLAKVPPNDLVGTFRSEAVRESDIRMTFLHEDRVYGFTTEILNIVSNPAKLFFFAYPKNIEAMNVRSDARYECVLPAITMLGHEIISMVIVDISREGCQCLVKTSNVRNQSVFGLLQVDKRMDIKVQFPGSEYQSGLTGKIRTLSRDADKILLGVKFEEMPPSTKAQFSDYLALVSDVRKN